MCWFFHKWSKWKIIGQMTYKNVYSGASHSHPVQERVCERCGLIERHNYGL